MWTTYQQIAPQWICTVFCWKNFAYHAGENYVGRPLHYCRRNSGKRWTRDDGYYKNEEATAAAIDKDGWLHTGDMGTIDKNNNIFIRGRNKSMLLGPSGQNIYPEEIEAKLNNLPFILESLVLENNEHQLVAFVYPDYDAVDEAKINHEELGIVMEANRKNLNTMVANYEQVISIELYPNEFEKTPKKSIKRFLYANLLK